MFNRYGYQTEENTKGINITEKFTRKSNVSYYSILVAICVTGLSFLFTTGFTQNKGSYFSNNILTKCTPKIKNSYGKIPLSFEENKGQFNSDIKFACRRSSSTLFLSKDQVDLVISKKTTPPTLEKERFLESQNQRAEKTTDSIAKISLKMVGAKQPKEIVGINETVTKSNYFSGFNKWQTDISHYEKVLYEQIYSGIDIIYYGNDENRFEYDLVVAPKVNPSKIIISFDVKSSSSEKLQQPLKLDKDGNLVISLGEEEIYQPKPIVYQEINGVRSYIKGNYVLKSRNQVGFTIGKYNTNYPLIIDPEVIYSTFIGGSNTDGIDEIIVDDKGSAYILGGTFSKDLSTTENAFQKQGQKTNLDSDIFIAKLNPQGNEYIYLTYITGSNLDSGNDITVDLDGNIYITGETESKDFPLFKPMQSNLKGHSDAFITKLNAQGNSLIFSTLLGGNDIDEGNAIGLDSQGSIYIAGGSNSSDFPLFNPRNTKKDGFREAFITKLEPTGDKLIYSTYSGGSDSFFIELKIDLNDNVYLVGRIDSKPDSTEILPTTPGAFQENPPNLSANGILVKLSPNGKIIYATYLGGGGLDICTSIDVDDEGNAYVGGVTTSENFPVLKAFQSTKNSQTRVGAAQDGFITKFNPRGDGILYSTFFGGGGSDSVGKVAIDEEKNIYLLLEPFESLRDLPIVNTFWEQSFKDHGYIVKLNPSGDKIIYSGYLEAGFAFAMAVDKKGSVYVGGTINSDKLPTKNAVQPNKRENFDGFVVKIFDDTKLPINDFSIKLDSANKKITAGNTENVQISLQPTGQLSQIVNLSITTLPNEPTIKTALSKNSLTINDTSVLNIVTNENTPVGTYTITIIGTSGELVRQAQLVLTVESSQKKDFVLSLTPNTQTIVAGTTTSFTAKIDSVNSFNEPVNLSATISPLNQNININFGQTIINPGNSTTITANTGASTPADNYIITVTAISSGLTKIATTTLFVKVPAIPDFNLSPQTSNVGATPGQKGSFIININRANGFTGNVMVTAPDTKAIKVKISPLTQAGDTSAFVSFNFKVKKAAKKGTQQLVFTGKSDDGRSRSTSLTLNIH